MIQLTIPMRCASKQRPRSRSASKCPRCGCAIKHWTYMPDNYQQWMKDFAAYLVSMKLDPPLTGELSLHICASFRGAPRMDADNLIGAVMDGGNGLLWVDDSQISQIAAVRKYRQPADEITIEVSEL